MNRVEELRFVNGRIEMFPERYVNISLLDITGPLDYDTPQLVLEEIASTHLIDSSDGSTTNGCQNIDHDSILDDFFRDPAKYASKIQPFTFHRPLLVDELPTAAKFVNKHIVWSSDKLQQVLDSFIFFARHPGIPSSGSIFYGSPTPNHPVSFNACMLYRLLRRINIRIHKYCNLFQLANAVMIAYRPLEHTRSAFYSSIIHNSTPEQLSRLYTAYIDILNPTPRRDSHEPASSDDEDENDYVDCVEEDGEILSDVDIDDIFHNGDEIDDQRRADIHIRTLPAEAVNFFPEQHINPITYHKIQDVCELFQDQTYLLRRLIPMSSAEAISLAALNYEIDISAAKSPITEYVALSEDPENYVPSDETLKSRYEENKSILRLNLFFNPLLPPDLYDPDNLIRMANFEGYTNYDLRSENAYSLLQTAHYGETFHEGKHNNIRNKMTLQYEDIEDIDSGFLVCHGNTIYGLYAFTYTELAQYFRTSRCFKNPYGSFEQEDEHYTATAIRKLKNICKLVNPGENPKCFVERSKLLDVIIYVEVLNDEACAKIRELHDFYMCSDVVFKSMIREVITLLMDLGMYMRGWSGIGEYPVEYCPLENQAEVDVNVTDAILRFETKCAELSALVRLGMPGIPDRLDGENEDDLGKLILDLPLLHYVPAGSKYVVSNNDSEGTTVGARIAIVKAGENLDASFSCIRLSSNWLCATAYRVMTVLGMLPSFQIEKLRAIS